jgi:hypothetical protein
MKGGTQAALVLGVGYVLGRRHKLRTATLLAAAAATGGLGSLGGSALRRGIKMLGSTEALSGLSPQLADLAQTMRGDLVDAGKAAAVAAMNNRIGSLSDTLHERAESLRNPVGDVADGAGAVAEGGRDAAHEAGRRAGEGGRAAQEAGGRAAGAGRRAAQEAGRRAGGAAIPGGPGRRVGRRPGPEEDEDAEDSGTRGQAGPDDDDGRPVRRGGAPAARRRPSPARRAGEDDAEDDEDAGGEGTGEPGDAEQRRPRPVRRPPQGRPVVSRPRR